MRRVGPAFQLSHRQLAWAFIGVTVVVLVAVIASGNLKKIYAAQPDFVLGSLLAAAGYCFAKATTRTGGERATEQLHRIGVVEQLRLIQRDTGAALRRLSTYYHSQAESMDFPAGLDLYEVILDDVDEALANAEGIMDSLRLPVRKSATYEISDVTRQLLQVHSRSVRESLNRRQRTHDWLVANVAPSEHPRVWGRFGNLTSDLLKAHFALRALCAEPLRVAPQEQAIELLGYLQAADDRAGEFERALREAGLVPPDPFETLRKDLGGAKKALMSARIVAVDPVVQAPATG
ncbi:hypothetical protein GCM10023196_071200 [Actinoallomurus vinaceus]|uniref:Uncharacterized protein n=1 Tax=Actinoallomurus vinaceus TaxID=1080074 RepID=A0ABP8UKB0_9ACTN